MTRSVQIVGGGLAGALLAVVLARRGYAVTVYERRADPRQRAEDGGRSINLALAARGMLALERAGVLARVRPLLMPLRGRRIHEHDGSHWLQPYGQSPDDVIWSVSRAQLGRALIDAAGAQSGVTLEFETSCRAVDLEANVLELEGRRATAKRRASFDMIIATDGAGSAVRASLDAQNAIAVREEPLAHGYRELAMPAEAARDLDREALHIWPRGGFMLIALPNTDGSFTATLFLANVGQPSFAALDSPQAIQRFFAAEFPSALPYLPDLQRDFVDHPLGMLGTVYAWPWHIADRVLLLGDAAHAIVPFHGQGLNCAFEDVRVLDELLATRADFAGLFAAYERERRANTDAIAAMALENYIEMRDSVREPSFQRRQAIGLALERAFPDRFIPRYSMVMFHPGIGYAEAYERGAAQGRILDELEARYPDGKLDLDAARALVEAALEPFTAPASARK